MGEYARPPAAQASRPLRGFLGQPRRRLLLACWHPPDADASTGPVRGARRRLGGAEGDHVVAAPRSLGAAALCRRESAQGRCRLPGGTRTTGLTARRTEL